MHSQRQLPPLSTHQPTSVLRDSAVHAACSSLCPIAADLCAFGNLSTSAFLPLRVRSVRSVSVAESMTDELASNDTALVEPRSDEPDLTQAEMDQADKADEEKKQSDEPHQQVEAAAVQMQVAAAADGGEDEQLSGAPIKVESDAVIDESEQQAPVALTAEADGGTELETGPPAEVHSEAVAGTLTAPTADAASSDDFNDDAPLSQQAAEPAQDTSLEAPIADAATALPSDADSQPSISQTAQTHHADRSSDSPPSSSASSSASSPLSETSSSLSSSQLVATLPAASIPSFPPVAVVARESSIQVRLLEAAVDEPVLVTVHITREYLGQPKPFLGGYKHHTSGRVKHHASVQTDRRQAGRGAGRERVTRETQTVETATRSAQSGRSVGTQMARKDYYIGEEGETGQGERVLVPGEYVSSDVLEAQREERARRIQCWLRVCFAVRRMKQLKAAKDEQESSERHSTEVAAERKRRAEEQQIHRRMHPKSAADFGLLYGELNAWRQHEAARIHTLELSDDERDKQLSLLLSKEVKLLQTIDRLKIRAARERKDEAVHRRLEMMQSPKEWSTSQGHHVEVLTPFTQRAQELTSLYQALLLPVAMHAEEKEAEAHTGTGSLTWEGRVDVLLHCKYVVGEMASQLSVDILQLIEREQEWVRRRHATPGWQADQALAGMRKRLAALFLQFVQTPAYNPEAAVHVDSVGREGKQRMQELLRKPLAEREMKRRPIDEGQDRMLTAS